MFAHDWIRTADLWNWKQLLYQLSHNHCLFIRCTCYFISDDLSYDDHPEKLNDLVTIFWYLSPEIRETLMSPAWKSR